MYRRWQLFFMIFCLGIYVFPKQNYYDEVVKISCCKSKNQNHDSCKKNRKTDSRKHDSEKGKECKNNCSNCKTCSNGFVSSTILNNIENKIKRPTFERINHFSYLSQESSSRSFIIWQPPKVG